jgi:hypothetical protein
MENYMKMKKSELADLAREAGVKGRSAMTKAQLARALADLSKAPEPEASVPASAPIPREQTPSPPAHPETPDLPPYLGENRLCLLPQKPTIAFAYWELAEEPQGDTFLRVVSVPDGGEVMSRQASARLGTFYIHLPRAGMEIESELGVRGPDGFIPVARSNRIRLPDDTPSEELDTLWMTRRREYEEIFRLSGGTREGEVRESTYGVRGPGVPVTSWTQGSGRGRP